MFKREWFDDLDTWYNYCGKVSMDDIYIAYFMLKKGIPKYVLAHNEGYITHKIQYEEDNYVFNQHALVPNGDIVQTDFINNIYKAWNN
jgi:hypothetical protein